MTYTIEEHKHRFAAWAAGTAAMRGYRKKGHDLTVKKCKTIIEAAGLNLLLTSPDVLPSPQAVDDKHREWRQKVIDAAKHDGFNFAHGVAAKLINVYLKAAFVCGGHHNHERVQALHPPIDGPLLDKLSKCNIGGRKPAWNEARRARWSKFNSDQYEAVINNVRDTMGGAPLWAVEQYWQGHR